MPIITSLLQNDLYKFTMGQVAFHRFPDKFVAYRFKCRNKGVNLVLYMKEIEEEIQEYCKLRLTVEECEYLYGTGLFKHDYLNFLGSLQTDPGSVYISHTTDELIIEVSGLWPNVILFEVPILAIVNEVYFRHQNPMGKNPIAIGMDTLDDKIHHICENTGPDFKLAEFGTRRRYSAAWQSQVVQMLGAGMSQRFAGTSNVRLAMDHKCPVVGTMAHEYLQVFQALGRLKDCQKQALQTWADEYRGKLGIALTDTLGLDVFLRDFDLYFAKLYDGVRHDSGDPFIWMGKILKHYEGLGIDPTTKTAVFSDGLDPKLAIALYQAFQGKMKLMFALGTNLSNDVGFDPLNIVMKMVYCDNQPVCKLSDSPGKEMCPDDDYVKYVKNLFMI